MISFKDSFKLYAIKSVAFLLLVIVCYGAMSVVSNITTTTDGCYVTDDVAAVVVLQQ